MTDLPPAGWYADPEYPGNLRYWDGQQWTEHRQPDAATQSEAPTEAPAEPQVVRHAAPGPAPAGAWDGTAPARGRGVAGPVVAVVAIFTLLLGAIVGFTVGRLTADEGGIANADADGLRPGDVETLRLDGGRASVPLVLDEDRNVRIEARSDDFDTTLRLFDDRGREMAYDDDGLGEDLNSLLDLFLDAGAYEIEVAPFDESGRTGGSVEVTVR